MLMLIPAGETGGTRGEYDRPTCKGKGHTAGCPSGPPPTLKLDEAIQRERERERERERDFMN
jgi:hypothetical protein